MGEASVREGVLAVGKVAKPGPGRIDHPLPALSEQDAARVARLLADERAELEGRRTADQPAQASRLPRSMPRANVPVQLPGIAQAARQSASPPWRSLAVQPVGLPGERVHCDDARLADGD